MPSDTILIEIERCWWRGNSIAETRCSVRRNCDVRLDFETIHPVFVRLANAMAPETEHAA